MKPSGIGGWLILPAIGLVLSPLVLLVVIVRDVLPTLQPDVWEQLTEPGSAAYHPMWATVIIYELVAYGGFLIFTLALGYLFFTKARNTPAVFIVWLVVNVAVQGVDLLLAQTIPWAAEESSASASGIVRGIISLFIWTPYFLHSERVRNTFVGGPL
jgi:hypothetical protein